MSLLVRDTRKVNVSGNKLARQILRGLAGILEQARIPPYPEVVVESPDGSAKQQKLKNISVRFRRAQQQIPTPRHPPRKLITEVTLFSAVRPPDAADRMMVLAECIVIVVALYGQR